MKAFNQNSKTPKPFYVQSISNGILFTFV